MTTVGVLFLCAFSLTVRAQDAPRSTHQDHFLAAQRAVSTISPSCQRTPPVRRRARNNTVEVLTSRRAKGSRASPNCTTDWRDLLFGANEIGVANGDDGTFKAFDGTAYSLVRKLDSLDDADNVQVDSKTGLTYVGYAAGALAMVDAASMKQTGSIKLPAHPESFQLETLGNRIFMNVPDARLVAVIDREKKAVTTTWPMTQFKPTSRWRWTKGTTGVCRVPAAGALVIFNTSNGNRLPTSPISADTDDLFYDVARKRLYLSCGEGFVDVIGQHDADTYQLRERSRLDQARGLHFFRPTERVLPRRAERGNQPTEIRVFVIQT